MTSKSTLLLEHHLKELTAAHLPQGVPQAGRPVRRRREWTTLTTCCVSLNWNSSTATSAW